MSRPPRINVAEAVGIKRILGRRFQLREIIDASERELAALDRERAEKVERHNFYVDEYNRLGQKLALYADADEADK